MIRRSAATRVVDRVRRDHDPDRLLIEQLFDADDLVCVLGQV